MMVFIIAVEYITTKPINFSDILTTNLVLKALIVGLIGGLVYAFISWYIGNWRFGKHIKD